MSTQKRKARIIHYDIRVTVWTDFMQDFVVDTLNACIKAMIHYHAGTGKATKFQVENRILDAKTFEVISAEHI